MWWADEFYWYYLQERGGAVPDRTLHSLQQAHQVDKLVTQLVRVSSRHLGWPLLLLVAGPL